MFKICFRNNLFIRIYSWDWSKITPFLYCPSLLKEIPKPCDLHVSFYIIGLGTWIDFNSWSSKKTCSTVLLYSCLCYERRCLFSLVELTLCFQRHLYGKKALVARSRTALFLLPLLSQAFCHCNQILTEKGLKGRTICFGPWLLRAQTSINYAKYKNNIVAQEFRAIGFSLPDQQKSWGKQRS